MKKPIVIIAGKQQPHMQLATRFASVSVEEKQSKPQAKAQWPQNPPSLLCGIRI
ncbi:hypothetical protein [Parageobacillus thermoglucosidasius]|uniref:hypothetical protein n=1 Tax=Parageobacillus thermoglucosidasius TaxID=1426 RepID=UPI00241F0A8E|nr:hypothetical protein [Parageobacillus thermoglucosidasius]